MILEYLTVLGVVIFAIGVFAGGLGVWFLSRRTISMYRLLWENEKNGNFLMVRKLHKLEEERSLYNEEGATDGT